MRYLVLLFCLLAGTAVNTCASQVELAQAIQADQSLNKVLTQARALLKTGFTAGTSYQEVWIRDLTTFIELSCQVVDQATIRRNLLVFFQFQGPTGDIVDGFIPATQARHGYKYRSSPLAPQYKAHKNTVETDQESSLVQAVYIYVATTKDSTILQETIAGKTVLERLAWSMDYLLQERYAPEYGLLWGATTTDWGDVQPEHSWGVEIDKDTHRSVDIYDNAMFLLAIQNLLALMPEDAPQRQRWTKIHQQVTRRVRLHLWDTQADKFIPHRYLDGSPFPKAFDEACITYHGGTAMAIAADLLSHEEIEASLSLMRQNVRASGAGSIGLTLYPPYPQGFFKNPGMRPYGYQNGGDWTWFGGRMIQQLIRTGFVAEAYTELKPMLKRVLKNKGFYEWYTVYNEPKGAGKFRGSAGVLGKAILMLKTWADRELEGKTVSR